jgi:hypothetical protein
VGTHQIGATGEARAAEIALLRCLRIEILASERGIRAAAVGGCHGCDARRRCLLVLPIDPSLSLDLWTLSCFAQALCLLNRRLDCGWRGGSRRRRAPHRQVLGRRRGTSANTPLNWIANINRDPNLCKYPPKSDRGY